MDKKEGIAGIREEIDLLTKMGKKSAANTIKQGLEEGLGLYSRNPGSYLANVLKMVHDARVEIAKLENKSEET